MHYAEFAEDESAALLNAIKEYENNKWKVIGQKVGKPAKACEQYAKEHFPGKQSSSLALRRGRDADVCIRQKYSRPHPRAANSTAPLLEYLQCDWKRWPVYITSL